MLKGFRDFIMRGNVIELAVAVAIGTAFTAVVTQFGESFVNALIFFVLTAVVIYFAVVAPYNAFEERRKRGRGPVDPPAPPDDVVLLTEIRDLLRAQNQPRP